MMKGLPPAIAGVIFATLPLLSEAALRPVRGGEALLEDDPDIVYLADMSIGTSQTFGVEDIDESGRINWFTANGFVAAMNDFDDGKGWLRINNWRLLERTLPDPGCETTAANPPPAFGFNCTLREMGHLYYIEWERTDDNDLGASQVAADDADFRNLISGPYWSGTENVGSSPYDFFFANGSQATLSRAFDGGILQVTDFVVPLPAAAWLFASGLLGMVGLRAAAGARPRASISR
jgi:hypothetical protein